MIVWLLLVALVVAVLAGAVLGYLFMRRRRASRVQALLDDWIRRPRQAVEEDAVRRSEAVLRGRITEHLAPLWPDFPYQWSDARFIGNPVDFVVFDGLADVQQGRASELRAVVLLDVKTGKAQLSREQRRIKRCLEEGRVSWAALPQ